MLRAAELWADARNMGKPTASDQSLDGDMIPAAQAALLIADGDSVMVATTNVAHLSLFCSGRALAGHHLASPA